MTTPPVTPSLSAALTRASALGQAQGAMTAPPPTAPRELAVVGDPQCATETLLGHFDAEGWLTKKGWLRPDLRLVIIGDYFDYKTDALEDARRCGLENLSWLAAHSPEQVVLILGNHDVCRVQELIGFSDASFGAAQRRAQALPKRPGKAERDGFLRDHPRLPSVEIPRRDWSAYSAAQRERVIELLCARRLRLATTGRLTDGTEALICHAGSTLRELAILGLEEAAAAAAIAEALNAWLDRAVDAVRGAWARGERPPLDLGPLHTAGDAAGGEGGGLLYHRACSPETLESPWHKNDERPRRFIPAALPKGLVQVVGHTQHKKCLELLPGAFDPEDRSFVEGARAGRLRCLRGTGDGARYEPWPGAGAPLAEGGLIFVDATLREAPFGALEQLRLSELGEA